MKCRIRSHDLGYGAMELRGAHKGAPHDRCPGRKPLLNAVDSTPASTTSIPRLRRGRGAGSAAGSRIGAPSTPWRANVVAWWAQRRRWSARSAPTSSRATTSFPACEQSLMRMKTDYLDLVQPHISPSKHIKGYGSVDALMELKQAGKVRFVGHVWYTPHLRDHIGMGVLDIAFQIPYSAMEREHEFHVHLGRGGYRHPWRRGEGRLRRREGRGDCNGSGGSRRLDDLLGDITGHGDPSCASLSPIQTVTPPSSAPQNAAPARTICCVCKRVRRRVLHRSQTTPRRGTPVGA